ncbi:uncharacterized protein FIBRA_06717 [Fibroporia radiculosa]|uniref:MACPF domain-containing protein n=1 Tax=Fibroporia radiculosa TaxID=599839 RepID=J4IBE8_9APHY|nr:uncharacterized protein FIBRA_06717 [Fibroporia radiculosa]CCM04536.1 predicted protein [Fibroporia radiculosa]
MAAEYTPYFDGMNKGQGFNTFTQELCLNNAVTVTSGPTPPPTPFKRSYESVEINSYEELTKSLHITAGAAITGWGQSGKVDVEYLNRESFEKSDITFEVKVDVEHQGRTTNDYSFNWTDPPNPNSTYGDRFISGFVEGGHFYALVSITSFNQSQSQTVKEAAQVTMTMYGVNGEISQEVERAIETLKQNSTIRISINETSGGKRRDTPGDEDLKSIKQLADEFYKNAEQHHYVRWAILEKYVNIPDFKNAFQPFDYFVAIQKSFFFLDDFSKYMYFKSMIQDVPDNKFIDGHLQKAGFEKIRTDQIDLIRRKACTTYFSPRSFRIDVLRAIKTLSYVAQRMSTSDGNYSDSIRSTLQTGATKLFDVKVYDFDTVDGSTVVSFASSTSGNGFTAMIGMRATGIPEMKEDSHFYVFESRENQVSQEPVRVAVSGLSSRNYLRLSQESVPRSPMFHREIAAAQPKDGALFSFYVAGA